MAPVTLFENPGFSGKSVELAEGSTRFLLPEGFNDLASSLRVEKGYCAVLYEHANDFGGYGASIGFVGDCADLSVYGFSRRTSFVNVFKASRPGFIFVPGTTRNGSYVAGHWERLGPTPPPMATPVVSPPVPAPASPAPRGNTEPTIRDHRGEDPVHVAPEHSGGGGVIRDHRKSRVKHLFVLMLENRSFDHMLGFSGITGTDAATGKPTAIDGLTGAESNRHNGVDYRVARGAPDRAEHDPGHGFGDVLEQLCGEGAAFQSGGTYPPISNSGFVSDYARSHPELPDGAMRCFTPDQVPVITALAREFVVCDRWFCSMPGPTEPNRWFVHAATAGDFDNSPSRAEVGNSILNPFAGFEFENGNIFQRLEDRNIKFRIYAGDSFPNVAELDGVSRTFDIDDFDDFAEDVASKDYDAAYTFIEPSYDVFESFKGGSSQHPLGSARAGELAIKRTYEAIRRSPIWDRSMLLVTYDEHGGFYDHVAPPAARPTGSKGRAHGFMFDRLGPRVPAIIISPLAPKNVIDHRVYEHSSVIATLNDLFGTGSLTVRSMASSGFKHLAWLSEPRTDTPLQLPEPAGAMALARTIKVRYANVVDPRPQALIETDPNAGNIAATLRSGLAQHLEITPAAGHEAILARYRAIRTRGEALAYLQEVEVLVEQARTGAGIRRSATVRRVGAKARAGTMARG